MAEGRLAPAPISTQEQYVSAPQNGADFCLNQDHDSLHKRPIIFKNGLIDPAALTEYMDDCHCEELYIPREVGNHKSEYHHLYFPKKDYRNHWAPLVIRSLRNSKYNLIKMLSCQEDLYHQQVAITVPHEEIDQDAAEAYLEEAGWLNDYAATSWLVAGAQNRLEALGTFTRIRKAKLAAQLAILNEMQYSEAERIGQIETIEPSIVNGALIEYLDQQPETGMQALLNRRLAENGNSIPTQIHKSKALRNDAEIRLWNRVSAQSWIVRKVISSPATEIADAVSLRTQSNDGLLAA